MENKHEIMDESIVLLKVILEAITSIRQSLLLILSWT